VSYLLDTCLVSEVWKPLPSRGVVEWLGNSSEEELFLSVLTLGEIRKGIGRLTGGKKREALARDYVLLRDRFATRILPIDEATAERWGDLASAAARAGRELHVVDGLLAATALARGLTLVTRNVADFRATPAALFNPWV
jgi:predicted nucleic acid-binding protein